MTEVRSQKPDVRNQKSETRSQKLTLFLFRSIFISASLHLASCLLPLDADSLENEVLLIGAAKIKITPAIETFNDLNKNKSYDGGEPFDDLNQNGKWDPVWLAGYQSGRAALGVHDDLWARAISVQMGETKLLFVSLDLIGYMFDEAGAAKKEINQAAGIRPSNIFIASTHNHSGPDTIGLWGKGDGKSGKNPEYLKWVREKIVECSKQAVQSQKKAKLFFGKTRYSNPIEDSRPPKVINDLLLSFRAVDEQNNTIATAVNYAMHAEVLNGSNFLITADYPGVLRDELEKHYGGTALFFPADIGGMQTPFVLFHSFWSSKRVGKSIAKEVIESLKNETGDTIRAVSARSAELLFPIDNPRFLHAIEGGMFGDTAKFIKKDGGKTFLPSEIASIQFGPAQFLAVPGELFPELGHTLRKQINSEYPFLIGLCNNEIGYIVPKEEWRDGGYEESMSLGPKTGEMILAEFSKLLNSSQ